MADVFISYKRERRPAAAHLQKVLERHGFSAWYDYGLVPGEDFEPRLMAELNSAKVVLVLWCGLSVQSPWVRKEADAARANGTLAPVWIEKVAAPGDFGKLDTIDISGWNGDPTSGELFRLLWAVGEKVERSPSQDFARLRELHNDWVNYGRPNMLRFKFEAAPRFDPAVNPLRTLPEEAAIEGVVRNLGVADGVAEFPLVSAIRQPGVRLSKGWIEEGSMSAIIQRAFRLMTQRDRKLGSHESAESRRKRPLDGFE